MNRMTCVDIFCGCGGFSLGMIMAGIEVLAAVDMDVTALHTYYANLCDQNTKILGDISKNDSKQFQCNDGYRSKTPDIVVPAVSVIMCRDVLDISGGDILDAIGEDTVDLAIGSPPCQSFSQINTRKKKDDIRDYLLFEYGRLIMEMDIPTFVVENVPPMMKAKLPSGQNTIDTFKHMVDRRDWELYYRIQDMYPIMSWHQAKTECTTLCDF